MRRNVRGVFAGLVLAVITASAAFAYEMDDTVPEVTDRVARISFLRGDVQIRRDGSKDWEKAELNLPIVEGDEIAVESGGRLEIQFSKDAHLRIDEASVVTIGQLSDSGIALSVTRGVVSVRLRKLDTDEQFFEIDGPGTTVAMQKSGSYRFDAGRDTASEVNISVTSGGEARVYSASSGFSIRSGRAAKVFIDGDRAGEWEMADASGFNDEFTAWADDRDSVIDKALAGAYYDKYYDQDIYGAEDLDAYGDWEYTSDYGYIWRPYQRSINGYSDWSPYRYGSWRWVPPFGWTWVNAEPWGWATYHYGRWIWYRGRWVWTPYSYYRTNRSWWYPALVVVQVVNNNICWYPLGWGRRYRNYNHYYHDYLGNRDRRGRDRGRGWDRDRDGRGRDRDRDVAGLPTPTPGPVADKGRPQTRGKVVPVDHPGLRNPMELRDSEVPPGAVISLPSEDFGWGRKIPTKAPPTVARELLSKKADDEPTPVRLPAYESVRAKLTKEVSSTPPELIRRGNLAVRVGASQRALDVPLDRELQRSRILGDRQPVRPRVEPQPSDPSSSTPRRPIGAVERQPVPRTQPEERKETRSDEPTRGVPRIGVTPRQDLPRADQPPAYRPPSGAKTSPQTEAPRQEPRREIPRPDPPVRRDPPRQEGTPRNDPPPRRETPPARQDPPPQRKPDPPKQERPAPKNDAGPSKKRDPLT